MILEDGVCACKEVIEKLRINEGVVEDEAEVVLVLDKVELEAGDWVKVDVVLSEVESGIEDREEEKVAREMSLGTELVADFLRNLFLEAKSWLLGTSMNGRPLRLYNSLILHTYSSGFSIPSLRFLQITADAWIKKIISKSLLNNGGLD